MPLCKLSCNGTHDLQSKQYIYYQDNYKKVRFNHYHKFYRRSRDTKQNGRAQNDHTMTSQIRCSDSLATVYRRQQC